MADLRNMHLSGGFSLQIDEADWSGALMYNNVMIFDIHEHGSRQGLLAHALSELELLAESAENAAARCWP